jgi:DNA-binding NarL/FixJ family response regulator
MAIKLLIADDDPLIRESLKIILGLDKNFEVLASVENGFLAADFCVRNEVDVALLDIRMPLLDGVQAVKEISSKTKTKALILTTFDHDEYIKEALKNGARGYLLKNNPPDKIKDAIRVVHAGNSVMQDEILDKVKEGFNSSATDKIDWSRFTEREVDVIKSVAEGLSNKEISKKLFISEGTVKNYITSILDKTGLEHRTQIAIYYLKGGNVGF